MDQKFGFALNPLLTTPQSKANLVPFQPMEGQPSGIYFRPGTDELFLPSYLIVCSQLPLEEKYYPLLVLAAGTKLSGFIERIIDQELTVYVKYVARLHGSQVAEVLAQRKQGGEMATGQKDLARTLNRHIGRRAGD